MLHIVPQTEFERQFTARVWIRETIWQRVRPGLGSLLDARPHVCYTFLNMQEPAPALISIPTADKQSNWRRPALVLGVTGIVAALCFVLVDVFRAALYVVLPTGPYLVLHTLLEMGSVLVSFSIFAVNVQASKQSRNTQNLFIGAGFLAVAALDVMHLLSYNGMPEFITANSVGKAIYYWLAARLTEATILLVAAYISPSNRNRFLSRGPLLAVALAVAAIVFVAVSYFPEYLPAMYVDGQGLTQLKVTLEYVVIALNMLALVAYWRLYRPDEDRPVLTLMSALVVVIFAELAFTLYASAYDTFNLLGHLFKLAAYGMIFRAIFVSAVAHPYRQLWSANEDLAKTVGELDRRNQELDVLHTVGSTAAQSLQLDRILSDALGQLVALMKRDGAAVSLLNPGRQLLELTAHRGLPPAVVEDYNERPLKLGESVAGRVAASGEPIVVGDLANDSRVERAILRTAGLGGMSCVPIKAKGRVLGVLAVYGSQKQSVHSEDVALLENVGNELGLAIENARLYESEQRLLQREMGKTKELYEITRMLSNSLGVRETLMAIVRAAQGLLGGDLVSVMLLEPERSALRVEAAVGAEGIANSTEHRAEDSLAREALRSGKAIFVADTEKNPDRVLPPLAEGKVVRSAAVAPLAVMGEVLGVIEVCHTAPRDYSDGDVALLTSFANAAGVAIRNARLYDVAVRERRRAETVIRVSPDAVMVVDRNRRVVGINPTLEHLTGFSAGELMGRECREVFGHADGNSAICLERCAFEGSTEDWGGPVEMLLTRKSGEPIWVDVSRGIIWNRRDQFTGVVYSIRDVTQRKEIDLMKDEFISIASHDLKAPIASVKGYAQLAMRRLRSANLEQTQQCLDMVNRQADHMVRLINTLLDVSRIQAGRLELLRETIDLRHVLNEVVQRLQITTDAHRIVVEEPSEPVFGQWDQGRLDEVLANLIGNAIKYSPDGGEIKVSVGAAADEAMVTVADRGIGIPEDDLTRVFERFYRTRLTVDQGLKGTGLGLYIVKAIIEAHGGRIWVESAEGAGSLFSFTLPRA